MIIGPPPKFHGTRDILGFDSLAAHYHRRSQRCRCDLLVSLEIKAHGNPAETLFRRDTMARPPLPLGEHGSISVAPKCGLWVARCRVRVFDGVTRHIQKAGK